MLNHTLTESQIKLVKWVISRLEKEYDRPLSDDEQVRIAILYTGINPCTGEYQSR